MTDLRELTAALRRGQSLSRSEMDEAVSAMVDGANVPEVLGEFLLALRAKGETIDEVAGAAAAMRRRMQPIASEHADLLDTCGTGGDGSRTFNISTATALVTAAAGQPVAKHGNRSITSRSGSADVLRQLGVNVEAGLPTVERCLAELGICFCYAPLLHPSMRNVAEVRRSLGVPTIFNLLGPLCNPAGAPFQLLGVGRAEVGGLMAGALSLLGTRHSLVVTGADGLDELTLADRTCVVDVSGSLRQELEWTPEEFGLERQSLDELRVDGPEESARVIQSVLEGRPGPARDIVLLNSAAALLTTGRAQDPATAVAMAARAIDSRAALRLLADLVRLSAER